MEIFVKLNKFILQHCFLRFLLLYNVECGNITESMFVYILLKDEYED